MDDCMNALEENERQTNAVWDSNFREANVGIVQKQGWRVVLASTTRRFETSGVKDVFIGTSGISTNQPSRRIFAECGQICCKRCSDTHTMALNQKHTLNISQQMVCVATVVRARQLLLAR